MGIILLLSVVCSAAISPMGLPSLTHRKLEITPHVQTLHQIIRMIPPQASVATQNDILPHLAQREKIAILGWSRQTTADSLDAEYILVDMKSSHFLYGPSTTFVPPNEATFAVLESGNKRYGPMAYADGILLLRRDYDGTVVVSTYDSLFDYSTLSIRPARAYIGFDPSSVSGRTIVYAENHFTLETERNVWFGPYAYLYGGDGEGWKYRAIFRMKTGNENVRFLIDAFSPDYPTSQVLRELSFSDFGASNQWQEFTIDFTVRGLQRWEFRGYAHSNSSYVALDYINVKLVLP